mmetsp:Transcript_39558/g.58177  ORF Transcript_39558/g.58177 Transcript_39558/m.58177 type:complete len:230 (-) Transcript_39558:427-1116(-)|eukprot:CAMPEP_0194571894 /NCGR_PEP_ID=MMETSP0292-20121207/8693_1 /TAXON_ID=39354 /ORGANISM="Heterosigma akashiwo, Strain CCMP2393" /LENGTH=229 /DNA_ID=CAMNT_0039422767 /DNA_START=142 /DNA_END=831 /DNA_ORIENTATION=-
MGNTNRTFSKTDFSFRIYLAHDDTTLAEAAAARVKEMLDQSFRKQGLLEPAIIYSPAMFDVDELLKALTVATDMVFLLTDRVMENPRCQVELFQAVKSDVNLAFLNIAEGNFSVERSHKYVLDMYQSSVDESHLAFLKKHGITVSELKEVLNKLFEEKIPFHSSIPTVSAHSTTEEMADDCLLVLSNQAYIEQLDNDMRWPPRKSSFDKNPDLAVLPSPDASSEVVGFM